MKVKSKTFIGKLCFNLCYSRYVSEKDVFISREKEEDEELDLTGIDDDEIDSYIMSGDEIRLKTKLWLKDR